ncbi:MAG: hypothetical protein ACI8Y4_002216 [Candidatus Poriferisodalaceae bacterium]|jgi:hypothetical protein
MIEIEPWNESAHRYLMAALATREGRSSALAAAEQCISILLDEFDVSPDITDAHGSSDEPTLDEPAPPERRCRPTASD